MSHFFSKIRKFRRKIENIVEELVGICLCRKFMVYVKGKFFRACKRFFQFLVCSCGPEINGYHEKNVGPANISPCRREKTKATVIEEHFLSELLLIKSRSFDFR